MEQTTNRSRSQSASDAAKRFSDGMMTYALSEPQQLRTLCRLSAGAVLGILLGIFCFYFWDTPRIADLPSAASDYITARAFSSYDSMRSYLAYFGAWFSHHALWMLLPLITVITVCPMPLSYLITVLRGALCGFSVCMLTGTLTVFSACMIAAQAALCALFIYLCTKCIRYACRRQKRAPQTQDLLSLSWLLGDAAPLGAAYALALSAQALGQFLISIGCTLLAG